MNYENYSLKQHLPGQHPDEFLAAQQAEICLINFDAGRTGAELELEKE